MEKKEIKEKIHYTLTIILAGYENTGKTTLINSIISPKQKLNKYIPTIGAELKTGLIETIINHQNYSFIIKFIELSGQSRFRSLINPKMVQKGDIMIFVYNYNDAKSFDKLRDIYVNCFDNFDKKPLCYLLCNKADIVNDNIDDYENYDLKEEVLEFCEENNINFLYCSNFLENCTKFCHNSDYYEDKNNLFKNILKEVIIPNYFKYKNIPINE